jgi:hypothetical protein
MQPQFASGVGALSEDCGLIVRGKCSLRQSDVTRAFKAAQKAGVEVEIVLPGGMVVRSPPAIGRAKSAAERNEWDEEFNFKPAKSEEFNDKDQAKIRKRLR